MKKISSLIAFMLFLNLAYGQSEFKKYVDANAKTITIDTYANSIIIANLETQLQNNFGVKDKVKWYKGIVVNYNYMSIHGKCQTTKGEILYFATTASSKDVQWDVESLSPALKKSMEKHQTDLVLEKENYLKKLSVFKDSVELNLSLKYDSLYRESSAYVEKWTNEQPKNKNQYCSDQLQMQLSELNSYILNAKKKANKIIWESEFYEPDFEHGNNFETYRNITTNALSDIQTSNDETMEYINARIKRIHETTNNCSNN